MSLATPEQQAIQKKRQEEAANERRALAKAYFMTFGNEAGQRVLKDLERQGYLYTTTLTAQSEGGPIDAAQTWANEGRRQLVIYVKAMMQEGERGKDAAGETPAARTTIGEGGR